jgi:hypothetical protein
MATQTPQPVIHIYKEINVGKFKGVKHYELIECNYRSILSNLINISKDRNCAQSKPVYWLKERNGEKWQKYCTTGLFKTGKTNIFKGDVDKKKHLLLFKFSNKASTLTAMYFENYYTKDLTNLLPLFKD